MAWNDFTKRVSEAAKSVGKRTSESVESIRLTGEVHKREDELQAAFAKIGQYIYTNRAQYASEEALTALLTEADGVASGLDALRLQLDQLKGVKRCPACGAENNLTSRFCAVCGSKMPEDVPPAEPEAPTGQVVCPNCGAPQKADTAFCEMCGYDMREKKDTTDTSETPQQ